MKEQDWASAADPRRRVGRAVEFHASIGSTNDRARAALAEGDGEGLAVVADVQTAGRGRRGRTWDSPPAANLMVSVAVRPRLAADAVGLLGIASALAVRDACASLAAGVALQVKWPNDVVAGDGRKVAGLLVETAMHGELLADAVIGTGINVNWVADAMPAELRARAVSLCDLAGAELDRVALLGTLLDRLDAELAALQAGDSPLARLAAVSALDGRLVTVDTGGEQVQGMAIGLSADGQLLVDTNAGRRALAVGEVVSVRGALPATVAS